MERIRHLAEKNAQLIEIVSKYILFLNPVEVDDEFGIVGGLLHSILRESLC